MTLIKFDKSVKYRGVRYSAHEPFKVQDEDVDELKKEGAVILSRDNDQTSVPPSQLDDSGADKDDTTDETEDEDDSEEDAENNDIDKLKEALLDYTIAELTQFAEENNIDLEDKTKKADIYNTIVASLN